MKVWNLYLVMIMVELGMLLYINTFGIRFFQQIMNKIQYLKYWQGLWKLDFDGEKCSHNLPKNAYFNGRINLLIPANIKAIGDMRNLLLCFGD